MKVKWEKEMKELLDIYEVCIKTHNKAVTYDKNPSRIFGHPLLKLYGVLATVVQTISFGHRPNH